MLSNSPYIKILKHRSIWRNPYFLSPLEKEMIAHSSLESSMGKGTRRAAVRRVSQSRTGLKPLSSSSSIAYQMKTSANDNEARGLPWQCSAGSALQRRGYGFGPWSRKIPRATGQVSHVPPLLSLHCSGLEPRLRRREARVPQSWRPAAREAPATRSLCTRLG